MWRAQSYIDETIDLRTGAHTEAPDWNNENPWTHDEGNVWDTNGNGTQPAIREWTQYDFNPNTSMYGVVAYSHANYDSPTDFNNDLLNQREAVRAWFTAHPVDGHPEYGQWTSTLAPGFTWGIAENNNIVNYRFGIPTSDDTGIYNPLNIGGTNYYPYTPGFTSKKLNRDTYYPRHTSYSCGTDCTTIVQRAISYASTATTQRYYEVTWLSEGRQTWGAAWASLESPHSLESASWQIPDGSLLVPGDILMIHIGTDDNHIGIVYSIDYTGNTRAVISDDVMMLDAAGLGMYVRNDRSWTTLSELAGATGSWSIRRLKHN
jgi:hypothetical protein